MSSIRACDPSLYRLEGEINAPEITQWVTKFRQLLKTHMIAINEDNVIVCAMNDENGDVRVAIANKKLL